MTRTSVPQTHPPGTGWIDWASSRRISRGPYNYRMVETWRREWPLVEVLRIADLDPAFNVAGLYWRPLTRPKMEPECRGGVGVG